MATGTQNQDLGAIWGPKTPQGAPGARNAQVANRSVIEKYHFGDRRPKPDFEGSSPGARMEPPKLTTVLQFGHRPRKKVNTVPQMHKSFLRMSWTTRLQICKVDRRSRSRCADSHNTPRGTQGCDCKDRQDIIPKVGSKVRHSLQNVGDTKSRLQLYSVNLKVNVPRPPRGVEIKSSGSQIERSIMNKLRSKVDEQL